MGNESTMKNQEPKKINTSLSSTSKANTHLLLTTRISPRTTSPTPLTTPRWLHAPHYSLLIL